MSTNTDPKAQESSAPKTPLTLKEATALLCERDLALAAASEKLGSLEVAHSEALAVVSAERDTLRTQFEEAVTSSTQYQAELINVRKEFETEQSARAAAEERLIKANENTARLEKLCNVKGIDPTAAVPTGTESPEGVISGKDELRRQYASIKHPTERARFYAKHKDQLLD